MPQREYDLEDRLLEYAAFIIRLVEKLPNTRAAIKSDSLLNFDVGCSMFDVRCSNSRDIGNP